ncbi:cytospin-B-like isoform X2 [Heterodontus francisci]|uniref:cytospin-B-like isoform X2 n=1 Tax=Heterodontus francisci TaxID=7792 RepID=UPI00355B2F0E
MKGAVIKPVGLASKQGSRSTERPRAASLTAPGTKSSQYSSLLPTHSQLTKVKSKSSDDLLSKARASLTSSSTRLKKTSTMATITELTENKAKSSPGANTLTRRSSIPAPRDSSTLIKDKLCRVHSRTLPSRKAAGPGGFNTATPTRQVQTVSEGEGTDRARLETQIQQLLAETKAKEFEIGKLRCELKRHQNKHEKNDPKDLLGSPGNVESQLKNVEERNQILEQEVRQPQIDKQILQDQLLTLEQLREGAESVSQDNSLSLKVFLNSDRSSLHTPSSLGITRNLTRETLDSMPLAVNGEQSHSSLSNMRNVTPSPDSMDFDRVFKPSSNSSNRFQANTNSFDTSSEGSLKDTSLVSVVSLAEKIQQLEEKQHCTAEELQATLQELSNQQQVVQELTAENERLLEEKSILEGSSQQHDETLQQLVREKEELLSLLQDGQKVSRGPELGDNVEPYREKLLNLQQPVSNCRTLEKEQPGTEVLVISLRDEVSDLQKLLEAEQKQNTLIAETLDKSQTAEEKLRIENSGLRNQLELEKHKLSELNLVKSPAESCEFQELLQAAHSEKEQLEVECSALRERSLQGTPEVTDLHSLLVKVGCEQELLQSKDRSQLEELSFTAQSLQDETSDKESEIKDMKETILDLQDQVEQHQAVKLHNNRTILQLEDKVMTLEQQKLALEKQLKMSNKKMKVQSLPAVK